MAKDLWLVHPDETVTPRERLIEECKRQEESCLYTSTACFEWVKSLRVWRAVFVIVPIIFSALGSWSIFSSSRYHIVPAACLLLAGIFPAIFKAIGLDGSVQVIAKQGNQFKNLQDRFRQAATITAAAGEEALRVEFTHLMKSMEELRLASQVPPERFFKTAQRKIDAGHYQFAADKKQPSGE